VLEQVGLDLLYRTPAVYSAARNVVRYTPEVIRPKRNHSFGELCKYGAKNGVHVFGNNSAESELI